MDGGGDERAEDGGIVRDAMVPNAVVTFDGMKSEVDGRMEHSKAHPRMLKSAWRAESRFGFGNRRFRNARGTTET